MKNLSIKIFFENYFERRKIKPVIAEAQISANQMSRFLNDKGGLSIWEGIRLLVAIDYKIIDEYGNVVYGNPENRKKEIEDNIL